MSEVAAFVDRHRVPIRPAFSDTLRTTDDWDGLEWNKAIVPYFGGVVLKVAGGCNLRCDGCYFYDAEQTGTSRSDGLMSSAVIGKAGERIAEHAVAHALPEVDISLHGGEPLLLGASGLARAIKEIERTRPKGVRYNWHMQTNATLLTRPGVLRVISLSGVRVGVSLDGGKEDNDRARPYANLLGKRSSFEDSVRGIEAMQLGTPESFSGILATVHLEQDPVETYKALVALGPPSIDLLLRHHTWEKPPPGKAATTSTEYADWLIKIYDYMRQEQESGRRMVPVRLFRAITNPTYRPTEILGLAPDGVIVIGRKGDIEQVDALAAAYDGATSTGLHIFDHALDEALRHPDIRARQTGIDALSTTCQACPLVQTCGGGNYTHRYSAGSKVIDGQALTAGFRNPSVYCADLKKLIGHIRGFRHPIDEVNANVV